MSPSSTDVPLRMLTAHNKVIQAADSKTARERVSKKVVFALRESFYARTDARARTAHASYHHLYEWGQTGDSASRLFKVISRNRGSEAFELSYDFLPSKVPVPNSGHIFADKARVMEEGQPVTISPLSGGYLAFQQDGETVFTMNDVTVANPGGDAVVGVLRSDFMQFTRPSTLARNPAYNAIIEDEISRTIKGLK
jgi:hypothetical protein